MTHPEALDRTRTGNGGRRLLLIVHPGAGGGRGARALPEVVRELRAGGADVVSEFTRDIGHAERLAEQAADLGRIAVAVGGDGLAGRVAGVCARQGTGFAALPGGRGNDFLRGLGVGGDPVRAARDFAGWRERLVDVGEVHGPDGGVTAYLGIASVGFDSDVQVLANRTRLVRGQSVYTYAALRVLAGWRPATFTVTSVAPDGLRGDPERLTGWSVAAANSAYYGGGMRYAPAARIDDGLLELVLASRSTKRQFLTLLPKVFSGAHVADPHVEVRRVRRVRIEADRPFQVYADGDAICGLPAEIGVRPGGLRLIGPAAEPEKTAGPKLETARPNG